MSAPSLNSTSVASESPNSSTSRTFLASPDNSLFQEFLWSYSSYHFSHVSLGSFPTSSLSSPFPSGLSSCPSNFSPHFSDFAPDPSFLSSKDGNYSMHSPDSTPFNLCSGKTTNDPDTI